MPAGHFMPRGGQFSSGMRRSARGCALAVSAVALAILAAACGNGRPAAAHPAGSATSPSSSAVSPSPSPSSSAAAKAKPCPAGPVAAPHHSLTLPRSIDGYRRVEGPYRQFQYPPISSTALCKVPQTLAYYQNSKGSFVAVYVGHHSSRWRTFHSFWGLYYAVSGGKIEPVPAGPLGGQAECGTGPTGTGCNWFDSDTFGELLGNGPSMSARATARLMLRFRAAVEHRA